jgi:hypothetical protein
VRDEYKVRGFQTLACGETCTHSSWSAACAFLSPRGRLGMITPVSILGTAGFQQLRDLLLANADQTYVQGFAERPAKLFTGVEKRLASG